MKQLQLLIKLFFKQIFFRLNAAVEAATVEKQVEVLSCSRSSKSSIKIESRSSKEIKNLVEKCYGKVKIMVKLLLIKWFVIGLTRIFQNNAINQKSVEIVIKEQQQGIAQINNAINFDQQTQANVEVSQTKEIANETQGIVTRIVTDADEKQFEGKEKK